jgi:putative intracellular protease/amidase
MAQFGMAQRRVLIVATSHGQMGPGGHPTGLWLEELATPYYALVDAGAAVTLASIRGGEIPLDPRSVPAGSGSGPGSDGGGGEEPAEDQDVPASARRFLADEGAMRLARTTARLDQLAGLEFDAVLLPGGHGTMWDFPTDARLADLVTGFFRDGKVVAAVCHGPAGLVAARGPDGRPLVEGRRVSGFSDTEEEAVGLAGVVPFMLEARLRELGGRYERGPDWGPFAVRDGMLVTGQNPQSSELVARLLIEALDERAQG